MPPFAGSSEREIEGRPDLGRGGGRSSHEWRAAPIGTRITSRDEE
jgi:hypothetical protein